MRVKLTPHTLSNSSSTQHYHNMLIARRDVLLSAIGRLLLPAIDFGTVYLLTSSLPRHISSKAENSLILAILPRHCFITVSPQWSLKLLLLKPL